jgi:hypothetical protein
MSDHDVLPLVTARGKGKQRGDDEDEEDTGGEGLRASEVVRREMGLEWMLKPASSSRAEGSSVRKADNDEKDEAANEEVMTMNLLIWLHAMCHECLC